MDKSVHKKNGQIIDKCGVEKSLALGGDVSVSAGTELGDGWSLGLGLSAKGANSSDGIFTKEGTDYYGIALGYAADNYEVSAAFGDYEVFIFTNVKV